MQLLNINKINKSFYIKNKKIEILNDLSYSFESGKFYAIMGRSGAGKTTLLNIISGIEKIDSGELLINGNNISNLKDEEISIIRNQMIGFIFQDFFLDDNLKAYENVILPMIINNKIEDKNREKLAINLLKKLNIETRKNHYPNELSGGEKQRVAIARALANDPLILLCDEPTGNLDEENENKIFSILKDLSIQGKCIIVVSHSNEVKKFADKVLYLKQGKLISND